jgi:hypothetical protein
MTVRPPRSLTHRHEQSETGILEAEILAEKAASLGRAGGKVEQALQALNAAPADDPARAAHLQRATEAVQNYFIQRELCGLTRHEQPTEFYQIPREVLARLGAR